MVGIDEVGRGCWAGPLLVVAAREKNKAPKGLTDSKLLSKKLREKIFETLPVSCDFGEGWVDPAEIDTYGLAGAMRLGAERALNALHVESDEQIIFDGLVNYAPSFYTKIVCQVKADQKVPIVSAASIYAKVSRDRYMSKLKLKYPAYGFDKHVGYGTSEHLEALSLYGTLVGVHRLSFKPVNAFLN